MMAHWCLAAPKSMIGDRARRATIRITPSAEVAP